MRVLFLNQYFPPDPAPTGILLAEIADALTSWGHSVVFVSSGQDYRGGKKGSRLLREMRALRTLFIKALQAGPVDVVISATSPPLLVIVGGVVSAIRRARHLHWLFDMYPELATALGELREGPITRFFQALTRLAYRRAEYVVALDGDMAQRLGALGVRAPIIPPWVFLSLLERRRAALAAVATPSGSQPERAWLYSGNLGRAHEWETLLAAQRLLEDSNTAWRLIFQGGGPGWPAAQARAAELGLQRCEFRSYVAEEGLPSALLAAEVLVATQKPETCGLLWPSKLALATSLPRRLLWVGPVDRAIGRALSRLPQAGVFAPGDAAGVARWLSTTSSPALLSAVPGTTDFQTDDPAAIRREALAQWVQLVERSVTPAPPRAEI